jgi:predicted nuclease of predicted toxin-antitoxin system
MRFIVEAWLLYGIAWMLKSRGYETIHTDDLPDKERTSDKQIRELSMQENRIVVTKDSDFLDSHYINNIPQRLLLISTGNIKNKELYNLFGKNLTQIIAMFETCKCVEMDNTNIIGHE